MAYSPTTFVDNVTQYTAAVGNKQETGIDEAHVLVDRFDQTAMAAAGEPQFLMFYQSSGLWGPRSLLSTDNPGIVRNSISATTYSVQGTDQGKLKHFTAATGVTVTIPAGLTTFADAVVMWRQYGAGQLTFVAGAGAVLNAFGGFLKSAGQYAEGQITRVGTTDEYILSGQTAA